MCLGLDFFELVTFEVMSFVDTFEKFSAVISCALCRPLSSSPSGPQRHVRPSAVTPQVPEACVRVVAFSKLLSSVAELE